MTGAHTPQGRVTALSQEISRAPPPSLPAVRNPSIYQDYFQSTFPQSSQSSGYSSAHARYEEERQRWASSSYKMSPPGQIPSRAQGKNEVRILLQVSYLVWGGKAEKTVG